MACLTCKHFRLGIFLVALWLLLVNLKIEQHIRKPRLTITTESGQYLQAYRINPGERSLKLAVKRPTETNTDRKEAYNIIRKHVGLEMPPKVTKRLINRKSSTNYAKQHEISVYNFNASSLYKRIPENNNAGYTRMNFTSRINSGLLFPDTKYFTFERKVKDVNCAQLFSGEIGEILKANRFITAERTSNLAYRMKTRNCSSYIMDTGYINSSLTEEEATFPLAYSILLYKDVDQFEKLLRAIYRPQNHYCVHVDKKSSTEIYDAISGIASCFENVFVLPVRFNITWGKYSTLEPEFECMNQLLQYKKWKYFINLTGQEFPLRTNLELVRILRSFHGANDVGEIDGRNSERRWKRAGTPPDGIIPVKGSVHVTINRHFVDYVVHSPVVQRFKEWAKKVIIPDEIFFTSLNYNPHLGIPGSYTGDDPVTDFSKRPYLSRFKNWARRSPFHWPCEGKRVRTVCVFGVRDLPLLASRVEFFANKFYIDYERFALECMEELHHNRTRDEYFSRLEYDTSFYKSFDSVKNVIPSPGDDT